MVALTCPGVPLPRSSSKYPPRTVAWKDPCVPPAQPIAEALRESAGMSIAPRDSGAVTMKPSVFMPSADAPAIQAADDIAP
jgi:hypothetical protein